MKSQDEKIFSELRRNARVSLTAMSRTTNIPVSTLFERLRRHERDCIIKHTTLLDFGKLGYSVRAIVLFKANAAETESVVRFLQRHSMVNTAHRITNGYDYLAEGVFRNLLELYNFTDELEEKLGVRSKQVLFTVQDIKREGFLAESFP